MSGGSDREERKGKTERERERFVCRLMSGAPNGW